MNQAEIYAYVQQYLEVMECTIFKQHPAYLSTELSVEADKDIADRPYYWMFVERTGAEPQPMQLTFIFDPDQVDESIKGERLEFGSRRLHQIFESAQKRGKYVRLYEEVPLTATGQGLTPWLYLNYTISYLCDQKKDVHLPLGFNLINGEMIGQFDRFVDRLPLTPKIPDYHFTLSPIFSLRSASERLEAYIRQMLEKEDQTWAKEANARLDEETRLIRSFFESTEKEDATLRTRLAEVDLYRPQIEVKPINIGLLYLQTHPFA